MEISNRFRSSAQFCMRRRGVRWACVFAGAPRRCLCSTFQFTPAVPSKGPSNEPLYINRNFCCDTISCNFSLATGTHFSPVPVLVRQLKRHCELRSLVIVVEKNCNLLRSEDACFVFLFPRISNAWRAPRCLLCVPFRETSPSRWQSVPPFGGICPPRDTRVHFRKRAHSFLYLSPHFGSDRAPSSSAISFGHTRGMFFLCGKCLFLGRTLYITVLFKGLVITLYFHRFCE